MAEYPELQLPWSWQKDREFCRMVEAEIKKIEQEHQENWAAAKTDRMQPRLVKRNQGGGIR